MVRVHSGLPFQAAASFFYQLFSRLSLFPLRNERTLAVVDGKAVDRANLRDLFTAMAGSFSMCRRGLDRVEHHVHSAHLAGIRVAHQDSDLRRVGIELEV